jgi:hypothetical protein
MLKPYIHSNTLDYIRIISRKLHGKNYLISTYFILFYFILLNL